MSLVCSWALEVEIEDAEMLVDLQGSYDPLWLSVPANGTTQQIMSPPVPPAALLAWNISERLTLHLRDLSKASMFVTLFGRSKASGEAKPVGHSKISMRRLPSDVQRKFTFPILDYANNALVVARASFSAWVVPIFPSEEF